MKFKALTTCFAGGGTGHYTQQGRLSPDEKNTENQVINLHPELSWEVFEGFGGAVTDAAAYVYSLMNEEQKKKSFLHISVKRDLATGFCVFLLTAVIFLWKPMIRLWKKNP